MTSRRRKYDENYEKPSKHKQWQERAEAPVAVRPMTRDEIEEYRQNLVASYGCDDKDITFNFVKIKEEEDDGDRDDCIWLKYKMRCVRAGRPCVSEIFTLKLPIPDTVKQQAEELYRRQAARVPTQNKPPRMLPAPRQPVVGQPAVAPPVSQPPAAQSIADEQIPRPKLRKPIRPIKK